LSPPSICSASAGIGERLHQLRGRRALGIGKDVADHGLRAVGKPVRLGSALVVRARVEHGSDPESAKRRHIVARELVHLGRAVQNARLHAPVRQVSADVAQVRQQRTFDQCPGL
jgi:hypothetical protein